MTIVAQMDSQRLAKIRQITFRVGQSMGIMGLVFGLNTLSMTTERVGASWRRLFVYLSLGGVILMVILFAFALTAHLALQRRWRHADAIEQMALKATQWSVEKWRNTQILYGLGAAAFLSLGGWFWGQAFWAKTTLQTAAAKRVVVIFVTVAVVLAVGSMIVVINAQIMRRRRMRGE